MDKKEKTTAARGHGAAAEGGEDPPERVDLQKLEIKKACDSVLCTGP